MMNFSIAILMDSATNTVINNTNLFFDLDFKAFL